MKNSDFTLKNYKDGFVTSSDGVKIHYRELGSGPGIILVHGGMMAAQNFMKLGTLLSKHFTVYIPDRRGRGLSEFNNENYSLSTECEDLEALASHTQTNNIFGLSAGALITLQTAIRNPHFKVALYEPPLVLQNANPLKWVKNFHKALKKNNLGKAFLAIAKGTADYTLISFIFSFIPNFILAPFINFMLKKQKVKEDEVSLKDLVKMLYYDIKLVDNPFNEDHLKQLQSSHVLLLGGARSKGFLKKSLDLIQKTHPKIKRVQFPKAGHILSHDGGKPEVIIPTLLEFFKHSF
jgi:pimeloyl-ACP methyl ester carboxylesterase